MDITGTLFFSDQAGSGSAPAAFANGDWSLAATGNSGEVTITITALPANNGSTITALEYTRNGGTTWIQLSGATPGAYTVTGFTDDVATDVRLRAINSQGTGPQSDAKSVTAFENASGSAPDAFTLSGWAITATGDPGEATVTLITIPANNGSAITAVEYTRNGGTTWTQLSGSTPGAYTVTGFTDGQSTSVQLRAVNGEGAGTGSDVKTVTTFDSSQSGSEDFTVQLYPSDPVVGEAVAFYITGTSGWSNVTDEFIEIDFKWDFGDPGALYTVGGGGRDNNANYAEGRTVIHTYESAGTKTATITGYKADGTIRQKTVNVTVRAENSITWDHDIYVSFAGNFSGFPAAGGAVTHASNLSTLVGFNFGQNNNIRITFRDDEDYAMSSVDGIDFDNTSNFNFFLVTRSGTGTNPPKLVAGGTGSTVYYCFDIESGGDRVVFREIDADGYWDPVELTLPNGALTFCRTINPNNTSSPAISYHKCRVRGLREFHSGAGSDPHQGIVYLRMTDCHITDWMNYGAVGHFSGSILGGTAGCYVAQHPLAINLADDKEYEAGNASEHGPFRIHHIEYWANENNFCRSANGWSTLGPTSATQPIFRYINSDITDAKVDWVVNCRRNVCVGDGAMIAWGSQSSSAPAQIIGIGIVAGNSFDGGKQGFDGLIAVNGLAGIRAFNNLYVRYDLHERGNVVNTRNSAFYLRKETASPASALTGFSFAGFNTLVNLRDTATQADTQNWMTIDGDSGSTAWTGTPFTENGNLIYVPNLGNAASFANFTLSPGDDFQLVTGSPNGIDAVSSGIIPALDYAGNMRSSTTNQGAHATEAASVSSVAPPTISNPVITRINAISGNARYAITDLGTVSGLVDPSLRDVEWRLNGSTISGVASEVEVYEDTGSGTLTALVGVANRSGSQVTAISNGVST